MRGYLVALIMIFALRNAHCQAFYAYDIVISAGAGGNVNFFTARGTPGFIGSSGVTVSGNFPFLIEFGLTRWLGVGVSYNHQVFEKSHPDDISRMIDAGVCVSIHPPFESEFFDLAFIAGFGHSRLNDFQNDVASGMWYKHTARGMNIYGCLNPRLYFSRSNRIGMGLYYKISYYDYLAEYSESTGGGIKYSLIGFGHGIGLNLFCRFGKSRVAETSEK